ncbi:hypothetical protein SKAU_G00162910 [Synaphobranchus kaupii]|uniref:Uncharacterized protein n=1 Tax=Synaphobranchus kaupii TaxID=118154 RepID=A0A9Q1FJ13_SYNKA|nr:hypothetical protein SKAU_G00162910 [Synaphobranchus kaupii]
MRTDESLNNPVLARSRVLSVSAVCFSPRLFGAICALLLERPLKRPRPLRRAGERVRPHLPHRRPLRSSAPPFGWRDICIMTPPFIAAGQPLSFIHQEGDLTAKA